MGVVWWRWGGGAGCELLTPELYVRVTGRCAWITATRFPTLLLHSGGHEDHDYVMYRSPAGGCCDCGDLSSWREQGE